MHNEGAPGSTMRNLALITDYSSKVKVNEEKREVGILNPRTGLDFSVEAQEMCSKVLH